jgi:hypothetical protein
MDKIIKIVFSISMLLVAGVSMAQQPSARMRAVMDQIRRNAIVIEFYGKVIDQYGQPVVGASVKVKVTGFEEKPPIIELRTDANGLFSLSSNRGLRGHKFNVTSIEKDGYEYLKESEKYSFTYTGSSPERSTPFVPDINDPIVYKMRKKGESTTFLLNSYVGLPIDLTPPQSKEGIDFVNQRVIKDPANISRNYMVDLLISGAYDETKGWAIRFTIPSQEKGLCVSQDFLGKAPIDGWQSEYVVQGTARELLERPIYIYAKSRSPLIFSYLSIGYIVASKESARFSVKVQTNPYGDTIMEPDEEIPVTLKFKLRDDAKKALQDGHLAVRPANLDQLKKTFKEAEEKEREAFYAKSMALAEQRLAVHIEANPLENWTSTDKWLLTYQKGTKTVSKTLSASDQGQWIPMEGVAELGGELLVSYKTVEGVPQPWAYLTGLNKRQVTLPADATFVIQQDNRVPIVLRYSPADELRGVEALGVYQNAYATLPLYSIPAAEFKRKDGVLTCQIRLMPAIYYIKAIVEGDTLLRQSRKIEVLNEPGKTYEIPTLKISA